MTDQRQPQTIHVSGLNYVWTASMIDAQYTLVKVWLDGTAHKASPILVRCRFEDPWQNYGVMITGMNTPLSRRRLQNLFRLEPITPGIVRQIIDAARVSGWQPELGGGPWHFEWQHGGDLREIEDATLPGEDPFGVLRSN